MAERIPPLYALRAFEVAARTCSFTQAGAELALTQSAISRHIRTLESALDCRLFERKGPKVALTDAGQRLAQELKVGFRIIEEACLPFRGNARQLRLKAPSTLTMRWLLRALETLRQTEPELEVQLASVWMDVDAVDFQAEPYDCAILLGNGQFGAGVEGCKLFDEWLIPICAPEAPPTTPWSLQRLQEAQLIHPSPDRRDWRRWLAAQGWQEQVRLDRGKVFDTLDQGISAAMRGHGVSIGDLQLVADDIRDGQVGVPFDSAVASGDGYYLVWPKAGPRREKILRLRDFLIGDLPGLAGIDLNYLPPA